MNLKLFISFVTCVVASVLMSSCSNEESADSNDSNGQLTAFTGGIVTEAPMERMQLDTSEISTEVPAFLTRTSMKRDTIGRKGSFLWEPNDAIYVKDDGGTLCKGQDTITASTPRATFFVGGSFTKNQHEVYYCGASNVGARVVIASEQTQKAYNDTKHLGAAGDCGVALAVKNTDPGKGGYKFNLDHKASYLCFLPFAASADKRATYKIISIEITSDNNISGTYDLTPAGLSGAGNSKTITLRVGDSGLLLADTTTSLSSIKNSLYVVIAPGTHTLNVKYTVSHVSTNWPVSIVKKYKSRDFAANKIYDIPVNLGTGFDVFKGYLFSGYNYFMWGAWAHYWHQYEWNHYLRYYQPTENGESNDHYPKADEAFYRYYYTYSLLTSHLLPGPLFRRNEYSSLRAPTVNELAWCILKGDPRWDDSTEWTVFGKVHTGGLWVKWLNVIANENALELPGLFQLKYADPHGVDLERTFRSYSVVPKHNKPSDSEIWKYMFIPALGFYKDGQLSNLGHSGYYWSSSTYPHKSSFSYSLYFSHNDVSLNIQHRSLGLVAIPFE